MRPRKNIENLIKRSDINVNPEKDQQIFDELRQVHDKSKQSKRRLSGIDLGRIIMKTKTAKFTAAASVILLVLLGITLFDNMATPAWAIEQTIDALENYKGAYLSGVCTGESGTLVGFEMWTRSDHTGAATQDTLIKLDDGIMMWTEDNSTYTYVQSQNIVLHDDAITAGFTHWMDPEFFEMLTSLEETEISYRQNHATSQQCAIISGSLTDATGPHSFQMEFDVETKLPVSIKSWNNLERTGQANFIAMQIKFFEQLPDSTFAVNHPADAKYIEKPIAIPETNIEILSNPEYGISAQGLSKEQASQEILKKLFDAIIEGDLETIHNLAPVSRNWSDESLKNLMNIGQDDQVVEILKIGSISKEGSSSLGPLAVLQIVTRHRDNTTWQEKMVVQFRNIDGKASCVINGPYGLPTQLQ